MATIKGKWVFNEILTEPTSFFSQSVNFITDASNTNYIGFDISISLGDTYLYYLVEGGKSSYYKFGIGWTAVNNVYAWRTVDFGSTEQEITSDFAVWFTANAVADGGYIDMSPVLPTDAVTIEYNGAVIASLNAGQSATLPCKDKPMHTDVVVSVPEGLGAGEVVEEWDGSIEVV